MGRRGHRWHEVRLLPHVRDVLSHGRHREVRRRRRHPGRDPHSGRLREVRQLPGRVPLRCHHTARRRARKLAYRRQPPPLRHDAPSCEPYRQPPPDPRHLSSRLQRRHLRAEGEPQRSLAILRRMSASCPGVDGASCGKSQTSPQSRRGRISRLPEPPPWQPRGLDLLQPLAPLSSSRRRGRFMPRANAG